MKVLVVEDEFLIAVMIEDALAGAGHKITARVPSARDALVAAERERPDLAVIDVRLVGTMDGIALAEELSKRFGLGILYATGNCADVARRAKVGHGCLSKPFEPDWLVRAVQATEAVAKGADAIPTEPPGFRFLHH